MRDCLQSARKVDLVKRNTPSVRVLNVSDTAVSEVVFVDLHLAKDLLDVCNDVLNDFWLTCDLQVIHMLGHDCH